MTTIDQTVDLNDIRLFVSVVEAGSITCASELLGLPKSYISRHMSALEVALGVSLMARSRRGMVLNKTGEQFFVHARAMLELSHRMIDDIQPKTPKGILKISVSYEIMHGLLAQHLKHYCNNYPDVSLQLLMDNRKVAMIYDGVDIAIRVGAPDVDDAVAKKIMDIEFALFASSAYLQKAAVLNQPSDLYHHKLIDKIDGVDWRFYPTTGAIAKSTSTAKRTGNKDHRQFSQAINIEVKGRQNIACNDFILARSLVCDGLGVAMLPLFLATKQMTQVLGDWRIDGIPVYALYHKDQGRNVLVASFVEFLLEVFALQSQHQHPSKA